MITARVEMTQTEQQLSQMVLEGFADQLNNVFESAAFSVKNKVLDKIEEVIWAAPEVQSLLSGNLRQELGITEPRSIIEEIIATIQGGIDFKVDRVSAFGGRLTGGGYTIQILKADYRDILALPDVAYVTRNNVLIPWLDWLLFASDTPLIIGYRVQVDPNSASSSRTGAIMVKDKSGGAWRIPTEYAGTANDNFLTRALAGMEEEIDNIIKEEMQRRMY